MIGSFRYESLPIVLRQEEIHFKKDRDSLDLAQNRRIDCQTLVFGAVNLRIMFSDLVSNCSVANSESISHITVTKADTVNCVDLTF
jgi:hypothetical protein